MRSLEKMTDKVIDEIVETKEVPDYFEKSSLSLFNEDSMRLRDKYTSKVSWCIVNNNWLDELAKILKGHKCLEIYGGLGLISYQLQKRDIDIMCTDIKSFFAMDFDKTYTDVHYMSSVDAVESYEKNTLDYVVASWIPYKDPYCTRVSTILAERQPKCKIVYIGEWQGGCTASDRFFNYIDDISYTKENKRSISSISKCFQSWDWIHDDVYLLKPRKEYGKC
jgi:hypothetical protein